MARGDTFAAVEVAFAACNISFRAHYDNERKCQIDADLQDLARYCPEYVISETLRTRIGVA